MIAKEQTLHTLRQLLPELQARYRVTGLALFGSVARNEPTPASDVDVLVDFTDAATLFDLTGLAIFLEEQLQCRVDIVPRRALRPELQETVLQEAIAV